MANVLSKGKTTTRDMTVGTIWKEILFFALPLMLGNVFQMLYNTVDSIVVGNFVGTQALAAVGSTTMITNMAVFFFNGFSVGAGVIIGKYFGAGDQKRLHLAIETTMAATYLFCLAFTVLGTLGVGPMLHFMDTPADVFDQAELYLRIYFAGIAGLLLYNMGSGILRAVGDSRRPLYFLIFTSILNIILDLTFVLAFHMGVAGVAVATILSQFISAALILALLIRTDDVYHYDWKETGIDRGILGQIFAVGLPTGIQAVITGFSNVFVQSYINFFGAQCMAGWACYNKIDQFIMLPMSSMAMAATTFVSQNVGARQMKRVNQGTKQAIGMTLAITGIIATLIWIFAGPSMRLFTQDSEVIRYGALFLKVNVFFMLLNSINHVLAGALRGRGDSTAPMVIMLICFVAIRQTYLFIMTHFIMNTSVVVGLGYPVGWTTCCICEVLYFLLRWNRKEEN